MKGRVATSIVLAACVLLATAGCTLMAPQSTKKHYDASDGVSGDVGQIDVRNAMIVADDGSANLVVTLVNEDTKSHRVTIEADTGAGKSSSIVTVEPATPLKIGGEAGSQRVQFENFNTPVGSLHKVFFQYGNATGLQLKVPVLTNQLPAYTTLTPSPVASPSAIGQ